MPTCQPARILPTTNRSACLAHRTLIGKCEQVSNKRDRVQMFQYRGVMYCMHNSAFSRCSRRSVCRCPTHPASCVGTVLTAGSVHGIGHTSQGRFRRAFYIQYIQTHEASVRCVYTYEHDEESVSTQKNQQHNLPRARNYSTE